MSCKCLCVLLCELAVVLCKCLCVWLCELVVMICKCPCVAVRSGDGAMQMSLRDATDDVTDDDGHKDHHLNVHHHHHPANNLRVRHPRHSSSLL
eukprot:5509946-Pyramimonas_sp.AAC.1